MSEFSDAFDQTTSGETLVDMMSLDLLVGSGGVLSHAPRRQQSAKMLIDAFMPEGITQLAVDSIFMMPQLGVLANIDIDDLKSIPRDAALEVFQKDCLIRLGTCISPKGASKTGDLILHVELEMGDGEIIKVNLHKEELIKIDAKYEPIRAILTPRKNMDIGVGPGQELRTNIYGGEVGIILDGRERPIKIPDDVSQRIKYLKSWQKAVDEYPVV